MQPVSASPTQTPTPQPQADSGPKRAAPRTSTRSERRPGVFLVPDEFQYHGTGPSGRAATGPFKAQPGFTPNLTFHGGTVLTSPAIATIYVGKYWGTAAGAADVQANDAAAKDFGKSALMKVAAQYNTGAATFLGSAVQASAKKTFTDADIQAAVRAALSSGAVPKNAQGIYTVVLPPQAVLNLGSGTTSKTGLGGYHGSYNDGTGKPVYYAAIVYSDTQGNGINFDGVSRDALSITESHEWLETMTDPDVNSPIAGRKVGWYDDTNNAEIGDEMMPLDLQHGQTIGQSFEKDSGGFMQQMEWSQKDGLFRID
jgi:hypothetical protein